MSLKKWILIWIVFMGFSGMNAQMINNKGVTLLSSDPIIGEYYSIILNNETTYNIQFKSRDGDYYHFVVGKKSNVVIKIDDIKSITKIDKSKIKGGKYWPDTPISTYYLVNGSAYSLKKGEGYVQNTLLAFNGLTYGITDHLSMTAAMSFLPILDESEFGKIGFLSAKLGNYNLAHNIKGGLIGYSYVDYSYIGNYSSSEKYSLYTVYPIITIGSENSNVSFGLGYFNSETDYESGTSLTFNANLRVSRKFSLIMENIVYFNYIKYNLVGFKLYSKAFTFSSGLGMYSEGGIYKADSYPVPYLGFEYKF